MPKLSDKLFSALNTQMNTEFLNERVYLTLRTFFEGQHLPGFAKRMQQQADDEHAHGMKFYDYLLDRLAVPELTALEAVQGLPKTPVAALKSAYETEQQTTAAIWALYELADKEHDAATCEFLHWFIHEQVEEEKTTEYWFSIASSFADNRVGMVLFDQEVLED